MLRKQFPVRPNWLERCQEVGFTFCNLPTEDGTPYWSEGVAYEFKLSQIDAIESAAKELHTMCMDIVQDMVRSGKYPIQYGLSDAAKALIESSWNRGDKHLYGRFDFAYNGQAIKLFEYNADTPTSLLESAVVQWDWVQEAGKVPHRDQFNSIHEKLIERWHDVAQSIAMKPRIHFCATEIAGQEDWGNLEYLMDTATQAGIDVSDLPIESIGWDGKQFVDLSDKPIVGAFKLYPWEWMMGDEYSEKLAQASTRWIEPSWKMILSSKALLPTLWEKHKGHPLLLPAYFDEGNVPTSGKWVRKPVLAREGANVTMIEGGRESKLAGSDFNVEYDKKGYVIQQWFDLPLFENFRPILGAWIIGDEPAGIGIREDSNIVTGNNSHFVPHYFKE